MSDKKYELTNVSIEWMGKKLFQIKALKAFGNVLMGELGGYIEKEENLDQISGDAWIFGNARISGDAWIFGNARISGDAWISGNARISGNAWISGNAQISGDAWISGNAQISGDAWISGNAQISGDARISAKLAYTKGWFIGGDNSEKITKLTKEQVGNEYWKANYVLGDFEINPIKEEKTEGTMVVQEIAEDNTITVLGKKYKLTPVE